MLPSFKHVRKETLFTIIYDYNMILTSFGKSSPGFLSSLTRIEKLDI